MGKNSIIKSFRLFRSGLLGYMCCFLISMMAAVLLGCSRDQCEDDSDEYPALPPSASLRFITMDSTGDWVYLFPDGAVKEGIVQGYHVDSIFLYNSNSLQLIAYRERAMDLGWYFPKVYYTYRRMVWPDTVEHNEVMILHMNSTEVDTLEAVFRYKPESVTCQSMVFDYVKFYLNAQLLDSTTELYPKLKIPI